MAKKKVQRTTSTRTASKRAPSKQTVKGAVARAPRPAKAASRTAKTPGGRGARKPAGVPRKMAARRGAPKKGERLGRARVTGAADLDQFFAKDYEARQVFAFLSVHTVKELEAFTPAEIIERLTAPLVQTVNRIRKSLALTNRCLAGDEAFALEFQRQIG